MPKGRRLNKWMEAEDKSQTMKGLASIPHKDITNDDASLAKYWAPPKNRWNRFSLAFIKLPRSTELYFQTVGEQPWTKNVCFENTFQQVSLPLLDHGKEPCILFEHPRKWAIVAFFEYTNHF